MVNIFYGESGPRTCEFHHFHHFSPFFTIARLFGFLSLEWNNQNFTFSKIWEKFYLSSDSANPAKSRLSPNPAKSRQIPPNPAKSREIPPNPAKSRKIPSNPA